MRVGGPAGSYLFQLSLYLVMGGAAVVYGNARLLGFPRAFLPTACLLGYGLAPLAAACLLALLIRIPLIKLVVTIGALGWSIVAARRFLRVDALTDRQALVTYPVILYYATLAWICIVS